jgi:hypothetical protein
VPLPAQFDLRARACSWSLQAYAIGMRIALIGNTGPFIFIRALGSGLAGSA